MNPILRNVLAVIAGAILASVTNGLIVKYGGSLIPLPEGVDPMDLESIKANIDRFELQHFIPPFLAHAVGTLVGAFIAAKLAATRKMVMALIVGVIGLAGGIGAAFMIPGPAWFIGLDLVVAYLPMAWLGWRAGQGRQVAS